MKVMSSHGARAVIFLVILFMRKKISPHLVKEACFVLKIFKIKTAFYYLYKIYKAKKILHIPVCAIGGINRNNITELIKYKPDMIGIISGIFAQPDVKSNTDYFIDKIKNYEKI